MSGLQQVLLHAWARRGPVALLLWPLSRLFALLAAVRRGFYRAGVLRNHRPGVPVVVVGNVVAGGSGKTPVTMALVAHLRARGLNPGVVSRGYGRTTTDCREVLPASNARDVGDEPALIARTCAVPVFVARRRTDAARALLKAYPGIQMIVCDDGMQHLALARDIEICVFDERGVGNGFLLPAGPLREPWPRAVDLVLHTGAQPAFAGGWPARRTLASHAIRADGRRVALADLQGMPLTAVAGIGRPQAFFDMLLAQGLTLDTVLALDDHHAYQGEAYRLKAYPHLVCTEKDAIKLWRLRPDAWAVPLVVTLDAGFLQAFDRLLDAKLSSPDGRQTT